MKQECLEPKERVAGLCLRATEMWRGAIRQLAEREHAFRWISL